MSPNKPGVTEVLPGESMVVGGLPVWFGRAAAGALFSVGGVCDVKVGVGELSNLPRESIFNPATRFPTEEQSQAQAQES